MALPLHISITTNWPRSLASCEWGCALGRRGSSAASTEAGTAALPGGFVAMVPLYPWHGDLTGSKSWKKAEEQNQENEKPQVDLSAPA